MHIAVYHDLPSGGAKRTLHETLKRLSTGHDLDVYTLSTADSNFCSLVPHIRDQYQFDFSPPTQFPSPLGRLNQFQRWRGLRRLDYLAAKIGREIDRRSYDVVLSQPSMWSQAPLVMRHLETPIVYYCHEPPRNIYEPSYRQGPRRQILREVLDKVDPFIRLYQDTARRLDWEATRSARTVLVNSDFMRRRVGSIYGIDPVICYHGIDSSVFRRLPGVERMGYVLSVGAIDPRKGFDFLIRSLGCLPDKVRPALRLVGNAELPEEKAHLMRLASDSGVDLGIEVGVSDEELVRRYNEAALVLYAPHQEPFGLVPLEAMACGTPVVAVAEGGVRETVVHGVSGMLVERSPELFAQAIGTLLADSQLRAMYGQRGAELVHSRWRWESSVAALESHLGAAMRGGAEG